MCSDALSKTMKKGFVVEIEIGGAKTSEFDGGGHELQGTDCRFSYWPRFIAVLIIFRKHAFFSGEARSM